MLNRISAESFRPLNENRVTRLDAATVHRRLGDRRNWTGRAIAAAIASRALAWERTRVAERIRLYCIVARDSLDKMKGVRGKLVAQGGHAFLHAFWDSERRFPGQAQAYRDSGHAFKITLVADAVEDLERLRAAYHDRCGVSLVRDAAHTVFEEPTVTCLGIGPIPENLIGEDLKVLKTLT